MNFSINKIRMSIKSEYFNELKTLLINEYKNLNKETKSKLKNIYKLSVNRIKKSNSKIYI